MNPRKAIAAIAIAVGLSLTSTPAAATDGDVFSCPAGTTFNYKVDNLSGFTFTVPTPPTGWTVTGVVIKVGGPGGGSHITFTPVTPGQVLSVANQQYEISHAHVCKSDKPPVTTTTTTTTTTMPPTTTTVPICVDCTPNTVVIIPTTTTTQPPPGGDTPGTTTTTTAAPAVTTTTALSPTGGGATTTTIPNPTNPPAPTTTVATALPPTGNGTNLIVIALTGVVIGLVMMRLSAKRP